jgi:hypothetical protein
MPLSMLPAATPPNAKTQLCALRARFKLHNCGFAGERAGYMSR